MPEKGAQGGNSLPPERQCKSYMSRTLKMRGGTISQANRYLGGFCSSQRIFPPQIIQVLLMVKAELPEAQFGGVYMRHSGARRAEKPLRMSECQHARHLENDDRFALATRHASRPSHPQSSALSR